MEEIPPKRQYDSLHDVLTKDRKSSAPDATKCSGRKQDRQSTQKGNIEACSRNHRCRGRASIAYSECVFVALVIQQPIRMRRIILSPVACPALQYFSTLSHKRRNFRKKKS